VMISDRSRMRVAAIEIEAEVGSVAHDLEIRKRVAGPAASPGAQRIVVPEFFSTGVAFRPELARRAALPDGKPTELLRRLARRYGAFVSGSTLVRDDDRAPTAGGGTRARCAHSNEAVNHESVPSSQPARKRT
jgi:predicted amidohydrolase